MQEELDKELNKKVQEVSTAVCKLFNSFAPFSSKSNAKRQNRWRKYPGCCPYPLYTEGNKSTRPATREISNPPLVSALQLCPEPITIHEAQAWHEWPHWRTVIEREVSGEIAQGVWQVVDHPKRGNGTRNKDSVLEEVRRVWPD